jgi:hypothetical protein
MLGMLRTAEQLQRDARFCHISIDNHEPNKQTKFTGVSTFQIDGNITFGAVEETCIREYARDLSRT